MAEPMLCPIDRTPLVMSERQNIEIDYCPTCRGVWLDRGELDKIIERAAGELAPQAPPQAPQTPTQPIAPQTPYPPQGGYPQQSGYDPRFDQRGHDPRYRHHKRKKSWLEEIFD
jgi:hypothetical protein